MKDEYSLGRYAIELIFISKLRDLKWWQFLKRKKIHEWRNAQLKKMERK